MHPSIILAPLPSKKQLWEASDELSFKVESEKETGREKSAFALAGDGELVRIRGEEEALHCQGEMVVGEGREVADWAEWCAGMDGLGGLVMLVASLVG